MCECLQKAAHVRVAPSSEFAVEVRVPNVTVPPLSTSFMCMYFQWPANQYAALAPLLSLCTVFYFFCCRSHHIVAAEAIVTQLELVHHVLVYRCHAYYSAPGPWQCDVRRPAVRF